MRDESKEISVYNEAQFQILRLNSLWEKVQNCSITGNFLRWKWLLDEIWRELRADVERMEDRDKIIDQNLQLMRRVAKSKTPYKLYESLHYRHEFLKILQDKTGKGGKYQDEGYDDFE